MPQNTNIFRDTRQTSFWFKRKFNGTWLEDNTYIQAATYRLVIRLVDRKIENDQELHSFLKSDYWESGNTSRALNAFVRGRYTIDYENFEIADFNLEHSETPPRGAALKNDNELILAILKEDARTEDGARLPYRIENKIQKIKPRYQKLYPYNLPDNIVRDWLIEDSLTRHLEDDDYLISS